SLSRLKNLDRVVPEDRNSYKSALS
ncbi:hypothetical protein QTP70_011308, partial [Hemibagrus guttatus]